MPVRHYRYHLVRKKRGPKDFAIFLGKAFPTVYLTRRESQCCLLLLYGLTMRDIAQELELSARTVEYYLNNIKRKMGCYYRDQLVKKLLVSDFLENVNRSGRFI